MKGAIEMISKLRRLATAMPNVVASALYIEAQVEMTESKKRCPVSPGGGQLRASCMVHPPEFVNNVISVTLSYGGVADAYAIAVHEHLSQYSPPSWQNHPNDINWNVPGTGPKFLESVLNESRHSMAGRIAARINLNDIQI